MQRLPLCVCLYRSPLCVWAGFVFARGCLHRQGSDRTAIVSNRPSDRSHRRRPAAPDSAAPDASSSSGRSPLFLSRRVFPFFS